MAQNPHSAKFDLSIPQSRSAVTLRPQSAPTAALYYPSRVPVEVAWSRLNQGSP
ncbi:Uncharacterised protein [Vibrio cholerae]|nr:Uncharacterised protein [Vibrio cholerae]